ncbi:MAG: malto-oligosyltrehalose trehalohydrolase [Desulfuromonadales bacterium]|nr:malto-oligosyltrehalose trehalohydrolase [Desulfuromonadales bacterium]
MRIGAYYLGDNRCEFTVWAPLEEKMELLLLTPRPRHLPLRRLERGYWQAMVEDVSPGTCYIYRLEREGQERPDPASFFQSEGVHRPSTVVDHGAFPWRDGDWQGRPLAEFVIYELHVGTFTSEGSFDAVIPRLAQLRELGVTAVEIMPVSQFPGTRGWGYDGAHPFAPQNSYGGPEGLKRLVDACHQHGLAFILDVVYNHLGPEGNYLREFGPYFTDKYRTPWGEAVNMDEAGSDEVRNYFIENALFWFREYHVDALRLDATDRIYTFSAKTFLRELAEQVRQYETEAGRRCLLIAESDFNDARLLLPPERGGDGLDGHWSDDFHHSLHTLLTSEEAGYYQDFGRPIDLAKALQEGYVYDWRYSPYRGHRRGSSASDLPGRQLVVCSQNHDQIGNRMFGHRLLHLTSFEAAKTAAAAVILSPYLPLLFMGEEYAEVAPFQFFADFQDEELRQAIHRGRMEEFAGFKWRGEPPDPHDPQTFDNSRLDWESRSQGEHGTMLAWYRRLLQLRREPGLGADDEPQRQSGALEGERLVWLHRWRDDRPTLLLLSFSDQATSAPLPVAEGRWRKVLDSAELEWNGPGATLPGSMAGGETVTLSPWNAALFRRE